MSRTDTEISRACAEISRTVDELVGRAQEKLGLAWPDFFIERSPLQLHWHFASAVWLAVISYQEATRSFQFDVARVSTAGDGISRHSRQLIDEREVRYARPASCQHAFVKPLSACLHYQRFGEEPGPDYREPPITYGPSPLCAAANDWSRIATAFKFDSPGASVAGLAELASDLGHEPRTCEEEPPRRINFREFL